MSEQSVSRGGIDEDMKRYQWVCWGHHGKAPTNPETGGHARHNDAATWGLWDEALALAERKGYGWVREYADQRICELSETKHWEDCR